MKPSFELGELRSAPARQYILRFVFGGVISVATGLIAKAWGPAIGGLFLAFPAVLPASLAFVSEEDGRGSAIEDARGSRIGASALIVFAVIVWTTAEHWAPVIALAAATAAWIAFSWMGWALLAAAAPRSEARRRNVRPGPARSRPRRCLRGPPRSGG